MDYVAEFEALFGSYEPLTHIAKDYVVTSNDLGVESITEYTREVPNDGLASIDFSYIAVLIITLFVLKSFFWILYKPIALLFERR